MTHWPYSNCRGRNLIPLPTSRNLDTAFYTVQSQQDVRSHSTTKLAHSVKAPRYIRLSLPELHHATASHTLFPPLSSKVERRPINIKSPAGTAASDLHQKPKPRKGADRLTSQTRNQLPGTPSRIRQYAFPRAEQATYRQLENSCHRSEAKFSRWLSSKLRTAKGSSVATSPATLKTARSR